VDEIVIRPAAAADAEAIAAQWSALVAYHKALDPDLPSEAADGKQRYARLLVQRMDDPYTRAFVAESSGRLIGYVLGMIVDLVPDIFAQEPCGFVADIYVEADYRRRGVGRALVKAVLDWFQEKGVPYFDWHVATANTEGIAFWRALGGRDMMLRMRARVEDARDRLTLSDR